MKPLVAFAICMAIAIPTFCQSTSTSKNQQEKEQQLRAALTQIRRAIDHYRGMADRAKIQTPVGSRGYPMELDTLVRGVVDVRGQTIKFLTTIPVDPMTGTTDWGVKRVAGVADMQQGGIFDIYTKSEGTALDGTKYRDW